MLVEVGGVTSFGKGFSVAVTEDVSTEGVADLSFPILDTHNEFVHVFFPFHFFFFDKTAFINSLLYLIVTTCLAFCDAKNVVLSILPSKGFSKPCDHA